MSAPAAAIALPTEPPTIETRPPVRARARARARLVSAAVRTFAARGYAQTTVADIVAAARMSKRGFYEVFTSKSDLLTGVVDTMDEKLREEIAARTRGLTDHLEVATQIALAYLEVGSRFPTIPDQATGADRSARERYRAYVEIVVDYVEVALETARRFQQVEQVPSRSTLSIVFRGLDHVVTSEPGFDPSVDTRTTEQDIRRLMARLCGGETRVPGAFGLS